MRMRQLREILNALPDNYLDQPIYVSVINELPSDREESFYPELLNDATEVVIDTDDNIIAIKAIVD